jgi:HlyD family secretion protein
VAVSQALAHLRQMSEVQAPVARQALRQAQASLDQARSVQARNQELLRRGFIGQAALDESNKTVELADAQLRSARRQLDAARPAGSDRAVADATLEGALAGEQAAQARGRYALLRAPVDGTLIARDVEVGDVVQPGKVLLTLSPSGRMQLVVDIDEKNLHLLALGQSALVSADAYPQERIAAHIAFINPGINAQTGSVEVKLDVPTPPAPWRQDMTVSVDIEVARRPQALLVPTGALRDADGPTPWVMRLEGRHAVRRAVQLGLRSAGHAELLSGLSEGDVLVPAASAVTAGARIHALPPIASAPAAPAAAVTADATPGAAAPR